MVEVDRILFLMKYLGWRMIEIRIREVQVEEYIYLGQLAGKQHASIPWGATQFSQ